MYKLKMYASKMWIDMPDEVRTFGEACRRADLYKRKNKKAMFLVMNEAGDILYEK